MDEQGQFAASKMVESLSSWWELAGVDSCVVGEAVDWLALDAKPVNVELASTKPEPRPEPPAEQKIDWPQDIEDLRSMIAGGVALPGNAFSNRPVGPVGPANAALMVISDLPDGDELAAGKFGSGASGKLLERMMVAIGIELADCYWTALATTIPATGDLPEGALPELADFVRHQINLIDPESIIVLGSSACRALLGKELMESRGVLRDINYIGGKKAALTTFHPRTLLARPQMKAQAWKDLQMFVKKDIR
jgi:uracil-DNA glycosylase family 4